MSERCCQLPAGGKYYTRVSVNARIGKIMDVGSDGDVGEFFTAPVVFSGDVERFAHSGGFLGMWHKAHCAGMMSQVEIDA